MKLKATKLTIIIYITYNDVSERLYTVNSVADSLEDA